MPVYVLYLFPKAFASTEISLCLSVSLSVCLSVCLSVSLSLSLSLSLFFLSLRICSLTFKDKNDTITPLRNNNNNNKKVRSCVCIFQRLLVCWASKLCQLLRCFLLLLLFVCFSVPSFKCSFVVCSEGRCVCSIFHSPNLSSGQNVVLTLRVFN